jgi:signal transduction histidine kinase
MSTLLHLAGPTGQPTWIGGLRAWSSRRVVLTVLLGTPLVGLYCVLVQWPLWKPAEYPLAVGNLLVTMSFFAASVFVAAEHGHRVTGVVLGAAALLWPVNWIEEWYVGPLPLVAALEGPLATLLAVWALLRYPAPWSRRRYELITTAALVLDQILACLPVVTSLPQWHGLPPNTPWLVWWPDRRAYEITGAVAGVAAVVAAAAAAIAIAVRLARLPGHDRRVMRPVLVAIVVVGAATLISNLAAVEHTPRPRMEELYAVEGVALVLVPASFLFASARRSLTRESLPGLIHGLGSAPTPHDVQNALRVALADTGLQLLYAVDDGLVDVDGEVRPSLAEGDPRLVTTAATPSGASISLLSDNPLLARYRALVDAAATAAGLALDNTRLQAAISARINAVEHSSRRLAIAVDAERRLVQAAVDDLVDIELTRLADQLGRASRHQPSDQLDEARDALSRVRQELAALAHGLPPSALDSSGLSEAVTAAAHRLASAVRLDITTEPLPDDVRVAAYFVLLELITNAAKHSPGAGVRVVAKVQGSRLVLKVEDDGAGGADPTGSGLTGVADRVRALGGTVRIDSVPGAGTDVTAELPVKSDQQ